MSFLWFIVEYVYREVREKYVNKDNKLRSSTFIMNEISVIAMKKKHK